MRNERDVKEAVKKLFKKYGVWYYMIVPLAYSRTGVPDFICCYEGGFFAVETKFGYNKPKPRQVLEMDAIRDAGGICMVINEKNIGELETFLERVSKYGYDEESK